MTSIACLLAVLLTAFCFDPILGGGYGGAPKMENPVVSETPGAFPDSSSFGGGTGGAEAAVPIPATGGEGGGDECMDEYDEKTCGGFEEDDACEDNQGQMFAICRKTCDMCDMCRDFHSCCAHLKANGGCGSDWMTEKCPLSCDKCEKPDGLYTFYPHFVRNYGRPTVGGECEMEGYSVAVWNEIAEAAKMDPVSYAQAGEDTFTGMATETSKDKVNSVTGPYTIPKGFSWDQYNQRRGAVEFTEPYVDEMKIAFVFKRDECGVKNFKQLVASDFKWVVVEGGLIDAWLKAQKGDPYTKARSGVEYVESEIKGCQKAATGKYIYIEEELWAKAFILKECAVDITTTEEVTGPWTAAVAKGYEGLAKINEAIKKLKAKKAFEKIAKAWLTQDC